MFNHVILTKILIHFSGAHPPSSTSNIIIIITITKLFCVDAEIVTLPKQQSMSISKYKLIDKKKLETKLIRANTKQQHYYQNKNNNSNKEISPQIAQFFLDAILMVIYIRIVLVFPLRASMPSQTFL